MALASLAANWSPPPFRPVLFLIGGMLVPLAAMMLAPAAADALVGNRDWQAFVTASAVTGLCGGGVLYLCRGGMTDALSIRQAFLLTPLAWLSVAFFGSLPLYFSNYGPLADSFTNAFFESMSGLTTTGSTVVVGLDRAPPGVLLWRALLQWMGGIGIIATAIAILPALGVGGMQLFRTESSDRSEKVMPRVQQIAVALAAVYLGLTALCGLLYWAAGMTPFDAAAHSFTTIATGGYSTSDASLANWDSPAIHWIATFFMISGAIPFVLYVQLVRGQGDLFRNSQVRTFIGFLAVVVAALTIWLVASGRYGVADAARHAAFNVVSIVTTTGYATTDYSLWGNAAVGLFFGLTFIGGCNGSTAGGMKIFRLQIMAIMLRTHFLQLIYSRGVFTRTYAGRLLTDDIVTSVVVFFSLFFSLYGVLTIALMAFDLDFLTSASAAVTSLANVGPGLGPIIGPAGNFSALPDGAKWLLSFGMLVGRLELFTVLILFMPQFWRG